MRCEFFLCSITYLRTAFLDMVRITYHNKVEFSAVIDEKVLIILLLQYGSDSTASVCDDVMYVM